MTDSSPTGAINTGDLPVARTAQQGDTLLYLTRGPLGYDVVSRLDINAVISAPEMIKKYGANFDGVNDDVPAFERALADAGSSGVTSNSGVPCVIFQLPAASILLSRAVISRGCNVTLVGAGVYGTVFLCQKGEAWSHGTADNPTLGGIDVRNVGFRDLNYSGSGNTALSIYCRQGNGITNATPAVRLNELRFRHFTQAIQIADAHRDVNVQNITVWGPDFSVVPGACIHVETTSPEKETFTTTWINVNTFNYEWGFRFDGRGMLEGHRFQRCNAYNGWGLLQVYIRPDAMPGTTSYQALGWYLRDCEFQGYGLGLDMQGCRQIRVSSFYCQLNARGAQRTLPAPDGGQRPFTNQNSCVSFINCQDLSLSSCTFDAADGDFTDMAYITIDKTSSVCRLTDNVFNGWGSQMNTGIEAPSSTLISDNFTPWGQPKQSVLTTN